MSLRLLNTRLQSQHWKKSRTPEARPTPETGPVSLNLWISLVDLQLRQGITCGGAHLVSFIYFYKLKEVYLDLMLKKTPQGTQFPKYIPPNHSIKQTLYFLTSSVRLSGGCIFSCCLTCHIVVLNKYSYIRYSEDWSTTFICL